MSKIGIITLYKDNFGSILQAYSTCTYIDSIGNKCDILEIRQTNTLRSKISKLPAIFYRCLRYKSYFNDRKSIRINSTKERKLLSESTRLKMSKFVEDTFRVRFVNFKDLKKINKEYDFFITGSDQVWNGYYSYRFLCFADRKKRIALAPSFGSEVKKYYKRDIRRGLDGFDVLSTREESGVKIIKELTGKDAIRLADPTILLTKKEWENFSNQGIKKENYILLHFLNKPNSVAIDTINLYLEKNDCNVYCISNKYTEYESFRNYKFLDADPYDYVSLINGANYVFTDSFHSTLFSLNLETQFLTFERQYLHNNPQNGRIVDLLRRVNMQEHFVSNVALSNFEKEVQWSSQMLFGEEQLKLKKYIKKALNG